MSKFKCTVIEQSFGLQEEKVFDTLEEARKFARKNARLVPYKEGELIREFWYYVRISCSKHGDFIEVIHP